MQPGETADRSTWRALDILKREGPQAVSVRPIARAVGMAPMAIQPPQGHTQALIIVVMEGCVDSAFAACFRSSFLGARPEARQIPGDFRARRFRAQLSGQHGCCRDARGDLKKDDVWEIAMALWAHVHGCVVLHRRERIGLSGKKFSRSSHRSLRRFLHGFKS